MIVQDFEYINENNLISCYINKSNCPCAVTFKPPWRGTDTYYCDFPRIFVKMDIEGKDPFKPSFLLQLCPKMRLGILSNHLYSDREIMEINKLQKEVKCGDMVYSTALMRNVKLIEKLFPTYGIAIVREEHGSEQNARFVDLKPLSQAKQYAEVELDLTKGKKIIDCLTLDAKELGFRVEKEEKNNTIKIRIYCENRDHLNKFINSYGKYKLL